MPEKRKRGIYFFIDSLRCLDFYFVNLKRVSTGLFVLLRKFTNPAEDQTSACYFLNAHVGQEKRVFRTNNKETANRARMDALRGRVK